MFLEQEEYEHAKSLLDKELSPSPLLVELAVWAKEQYNVTVIDYICDALIDGTLRMRPVLWDDKEEKCLCTGVHYGFDPVIQQAFADKFRFLCRKYGLHEEYAATNDIFVAYETLEDELKKRILRLIMNDLKKLEGGDIWLMTSNFLRIEIYYQTDAQIEEKEADGTSESIRRYCWELVTKYDKYGLWDNARLCFFTSHQTFMEKYEGSWRRYWD